MAPNTDCLSNETSICLSIPHFNFSLAFREGLLSGSLDYLLAFFMNCYSFRDWFINSHDLTPMQIQDFKTLFQENIYLQLCRDICNGTKHLNYKKPSLDASPSIVRNFVPDPYFGEHAYPGKLLLIHADGQVYNLSELATSCVNALRDFLVSHGLIKE